MKIGIVCPYNIFLPGGVASHVYHQAAELRSRGHEAIIITPRPQGHADPAPDGAIFIGQSARIRAQHTAADISASVDVDVIDTVLGRENFGIIHVHEPLIPFLALQLLSRVTCPTVGTFHAALPDTILAKPIAGSIGPYKRSVFKHLNAVTAVSKAATSFIEHDFDPQKIAIIPNGIDPAPFARGQERRRNEETFVYVGRLEKRKGVRYLLDAFALVKQEMPQARLVIAGDGPERPMLENRARQRKISGVEFLGYVSDEQKIELMTSCSVFVSPSPYGESFGIILLEAMAAGAVTVAGANPGYESVLIGTGRLSLVDPRVTQEFARRLVLMASDRQLADLWRKWAKKEVTQFSYPKIVDAYMQVYDSLVAARA